MQEDSKKREETIGSVLIDARSQAGLSQAEIATQMNLTVRTIQALEEDDFDSLPGPTYVRGYLHTYSKLVGLDGGQLIRIYNEQNPAEPEPQPPARPNRRRGPVVLLTGAALVVLAGAYLLVQTPDPQPSVQVPDQTAAPEESVSVSEKASEPPEEPVAVPEEAPRPPEEPVASPEEALKAPVDSDISAPTPSGELQSQEIPAANVDDNEPVRPPVDAGVQVSEQRPVTDGPPAADEDLEVLTMTFMDDSWIEVRDADMQLIMWDLIRSGAALEIKGKAPFEVLLGNSPDVIIHIDGKRFDHSRFHQSDRTSRFKVKVSGSLLN